MTTLKLTTKNKVSIDLRETDARRCLANARMDLIKMSDELIKSFDNDEPRGTFEHAPLLSIIRNIEEELNR